MPVPAVFGNRADPAGYPLGSCIRVFDRLIALFSLWKGRDPLILACLFGLTAASLVLPLIRIVGVRIIRIIRIIRIGIWIREAETDRESEAYEDRIGPKKTVIGEKAIIREEVAVQTIKSTVEKSTTPSKARSLKLVESATVKTHTTSLKTSRTTAMKTATTKTPAT